MQYKNRIKVYLITFVIALLIAGQVHASPPDNETELIFKDEELARLGNAGAEFRMGARFLNGAGVNVDYEKARTYLTRAAAKGHSNALYNLGYIYIYGYGVKVNFELAAKYFEDSAARGFAPAYHVLGVMMEDGAWFKRSKEAAIKEYNKAAEMGYEPSIRRLKELNDE